MPPVSLVPSTAKAFMTGHCRPVRLSKEFRSDTASMFGFKGVPGENSALIPFFTQLLHIFSTEHPPVQEAGAAVAGRRIGRSGAQLGRADADGACFYQPRRSRSSLFARAAGLRMTATRATL